MMLKPQRKPGLGIPATLPTRKPARHPHADSPYYDPESGIYDPPINRVGSPLTDAETGSAITVMLSRIAGRRAAAESIRRVRQAADTVEDFLGGRPDPKDIKINDHKDITIFKGDKKFRMDINHPGYDKNGNIDKPHFHLREKRNGKWKDTGKIHHYYFKQGD